MIFEERDDGDDAGGRNVNRELIFPYRELLDEFGQAREKVLAVGMEAGGLLLILVRRVYDRCMKLPSSYMNISN